MSVLQKGSTEKLEVVGVQGVGCCCVYKGGEISGVLSMFWVVFVDGSSVSGCAVHVLGGFCGREWCFGAGFWGVFGRGAILIE